MRFTSLFGGPTETRQDSSYTDALVQAIQGQATGQTTALPGATAALEACAGFVGRSFAAAEVRAADGLLPVLSPSFLRLVGRTLIRRGELVCLLRVTRGGVLSVMPADSYDLDGYPDPASWRYRVTVGGPERTYTYEHVEPSGILHFTYAVEPGRPWRGLGPLTVASLAGKLSSETVAALGDEASGPRGSLISTPVDGEDESVQELKRDLATLGGRAALVEGGDWDNVGGGRMQSWGKTRIGADPPKVWSTLRGLPRAK